MADNEPVQLVDIHNRPCGAAPRRYVRELGLRHRATFIFVFNGDGKLFLHRRSKTKDLCPGYYDAAAGGVLRPGESYTGNAYREVAEELGIEGAPLAARDQFYFEEPNYKIWGQIFVTRWDGPMVFNDGEVEDGWFVAPQAVLDGAYTPITSDTMYALRQTDVTPPSSYPMSQKARPAGRYSSTLQPPSTKLAPSSNTADTGRKIPRRG